MKRTNAAIDFWPLLLWIWVVLALFLLQPHPAGGQEGEDGKTLPAPALLRQIWHPGPPRPKAMQELEKALFKATNQQRSLSAATPQPLKPNPSLVEVAAQFSLRMRDEGFFSHDDPAGAGPSDRVGKGMRTAFGTSAENIARLTDRPDLAEAFMKAWMNSPSHGKNILDSFRTDLGVGCAEAKPDDMQVWVNCTQLFMSLYASLRQPFPDTVKAGQAVDVEIAPENGNPVPVRLSQTNLQTGSVASAADLREHNGAGAGKLVVQGPSGVYRLDLDIPDQTTRGRFIIVPGPYLTVQP